MPPSYQYPKPTCKNIPHGWNECCYIQRCKKCTQPCNEIPRIHEDKLNRWATQTFKMELKHAWQPIIWGSRLSFRLEHIYDNCLNEGIFGSRKKQNGSTCICYVHKNLNVTNLITSDLNTIGLNSSKFLELLLKLGNCCRQRQTSNINGVTLNCKRTVYNLLSTSNENITDINFYMLLRCANMAKDSEPRVDSPGNVSLPQSKLLIRSATHGKWGPHILLCMSFDEQASLALIMAHSPGPISHPRSLSHLPCLHVWDSECIKCCLHLHRLKSPKTSNLKENC